MEKMDLDFEAGAQTIQECEGSKGCTSAAKERLRNRWGCPSVRQGNLLTEVMDKTRTVSDFFCLGFYC